MTAAETELAAEVARLQARLAVLEAAEQERDTLRAEQAATAHILRGIRDAAQGSQPTLQAIADAVLQLCDAAIARVWLVEGEELVAGPGAFVAGAEFRVPGTRLQQGLQGYGGLAEAARTRCTVHTPDMVERLVALGAPTDVIAAAREREAATGQRTALCIPLVHGEQLLGVLALSRTGAVRPFTAGQIGLAETFAAQAAIALANASLLEQTQAQQRELAEHNAGLQAALDQQTATADILRVLSGSPADAQPVFETVSAAALRLLRSDRATIWLPDGDRLRVVAGAGVGLAASTWETTLPLAGNLTTAQAFLRGKPVQLSDPEDVNLAFKREFAPAEDLQPTLGLRARLATPLLLKGEAVGVLAVGRVAWEPYSPTEIALLETFASQAAIAIENARLFGALQASNASLQESLEQQTAMATVLAAVARAGTDPDPVLFDIAEQAGRLLGGELGSLNLFSPDGPSRAFQSLLRPSSTGDYADDSIGEEVATGRRLIATAMPRTELAQQRLPVAEMLASRAPTQVWGTRDALTARYPDMKIGTGWTELSRVFVPLWAQGEVVGVLVVTRRLAQPFTGQQVALLQAFADQAVIAVQNARLLRELQQRNVALVESLERQTATADILRIISQSPTALEPVFTAIVEHAERLVDGAGAFMYMREGANVRAVAWTAPTVPETPFQRGQAHPPPPGSALLRVLDSHELLHLYGDIESVEQAFPGIARTWRSLGYGSTVAIPLCRHDDVIGVLLVHRRLPEPFAPQHLALLETFADQAVIAIENARLFEQIQSKSEELEETNRQLENATQHKSAFLSAMSHELRTPLNAVIGYSEMLTEEAQDLGEPRFVADLEKINGAGKHLLSLISNVLDLSKIEAGKMDLLLSDFAVQKVLDEVEAVVPPLMGQRSNRFVLDAAPHLGLMHSDQTKLRQCLLNVLSNAAKFTERGTITLAARRETAPAGDWLVFTVADNGIGMTAEQQVRLFQSFSQAEASTSARYGGTGLGLALSREFCRLLGGDISVLSEPGMGSTFTIRLPSQCPER